LIGAFTLEKENTRTKKKMTTTLDFKLGDLITTSKGSRQIPVTTQTSSPLIWMPNDALSVCYQPSAFNEPDATRVNICLGMTDSLEKQLNSFDDSLIISIAENSKKYFGQVLTNEEVKQKMQPSVRVSEKGISHWRCKINIAGRGKCQCYGMDKNVRALPESWLECKVRPRVLLKSIWIMSKEIGCLWEVVAAQIDEQPKECPF
jgi:hypothetical protein